MAHSLRATTLVFAAALVAQLLALATPAQADVTGTWTNTGALSGADCPVTWTGDSTYSVEATSIIKITQAAGQAGCSLTITSTDLSTWQISTDSGTSWTTLSGPYEGLDASGGSFPRQVWMRVGTTAATIGSGDLTSNWGANFQIAVISIFPIQDRGSAELTFRLPDGRECGTISPVSVAIDSMYVLPEAGADCRAANDEAIIGWKVGWDDLVHPPGHPVLVVDSQQFTAVLKSQGLTVAFDANVAVGDICAIGATDVPVGFRTITQEVDRNDLADYRLMMRPVCRPFGHYFTGWSIDPAGDPLPLGSPPPANWSTTDANVVTVYAQWAPQPVAVVDINAFASTITPITGVQVMVGDVTPAADVNAGSLTLTSASPPSSLLASASPAMSQAIDDFFTNGGQSLTIVPSGGSDAASLTAAINRIDVANTLDLAVPELRGLTAQEWVGPATSLVEKAHSLEAMAWLDPPAQTVAVPAAQQDQAISGVIALAQRLRGEVGSNSSAGTLLSTGVVDISGAARAASPATLGVRVTTDRNYGVWDHMGALDGLAGVTSETNPTPRENGNLMINGVSAVVDFPSGQTIVAPNVTLDPSVRTTQQRFEDWLLQSLKVGLADIEKFPNGPQTQLVATMQIASLLSTLYEEGALSGNTPSQAYQIKCSATQQAIEDGYMTCDLTLQLLMPPLREITLQVPVQPGLPTEANPAPSLPNLVFQVSGGSFEAPSILE